MVEKFIFRPFQDRLLYVRFAVFFSLFTVSFLLWQLKIGFKKSLVYTKIGRKRDIHPISKYLFVTGLTTAICSVFAGIFLILDLSIFFRRKRTKHKWYFLNIGSDLSGSDFVGKLLNIEFSFRWLSVVTLLMFVYKILSITNIVQTLYKT